MDLNRLSGLETPAPGSDAKARAIAAAMAAYDGAENNSTATQGSANDARPMNILNLIGRLIMNRRLLASSALATLLIIPAAGWLTFRIIEDRGTMMTEEIAKKTDIAKKADAPKTNVVPSEKMVADDGSAGKLTPSLQTELKKDTASDNASPAKPELLQEEIPASKYKTENAPAKIGLAAPEASQDAMANEGIVAGATATNRERMEAAPLPSVVPADSETMTAMEPQPGLIVADESMRQQQLTQANGDKFSSKDINPVKNVATEPVSTFSIDVDTASYAVMRNSISGGMLPDPDSVRVEEMVNYFPYNWAGPTSADEAFKANVTVTPTPWNPNTKLMHVAIKGFEAQMASQPAANLVFLIDVSGSMDEPAKLPLLKSAFRLLVGKLRPTDTVSIVVYAGNSGVVLEPTKVAEKQKILQAIDNLQPGGSTAGAAGIETAYDLAKRAFVKDGVNRVMLATDGDFNVGPASDDELKSLIEKERKSGIFLSVLGFGTGNYNDSLMQTLAQNGNGTAAYIDTLGEAQKTLVQEATASLFPIAKDVKIQVEFNPARIAEYRLIGYETRALNREDFNNDRVDAGEIGSGHRVTAIYEVTPKGSPAMLNDDLRYGQEKPAQPVETTQASDELAFVKIRYKKPNEDVSKLVTMPVTDALAKDTFDAAPVDVRFSVAVAAFGQKLKNEPMLDNFSYDKIVDIANAAKGEDGFGYRAEFVNLVRLASGLKAE